MKLSGGIKFILHFKEVFIQKIVANLVSFRSFRVPDPGYVIIRLLFCLISTADCHTRTPITADLEVRGRISGIEILL
jgi:hypothetical protein